MGDMVNWAVSKNREYSSEKIAVDYDKEEDILSLSKEGNKVKFSLDLEFPKGDFVIDYGFDGKIVGIEFFNASSYFPMLKDFSDVKGIKGYNKGILYAY